MPHLCWNFSSQFGRLQILQHLPKFISVGWICSQSFDDPGQIWMHSGPIGCRIGDKTIQKLVVNGGLMHEFLKCQLGCARSCTGVAGQIESWLRGKSQPVQVTALLNYLANGLSSLVIATDGLRKDLVLRVTQIPHGWFIDSDLQVLSRNMQSIGSQTNIL